MSETVMLTSTPPCCRWRARGTVALPCPAWACAWCGADGQACDVDEIGDAGLRARTCSQGYWRLPEKTAEEFTLDGWFKTGDVGRGSMASSTRHHRGPQQGRDHHRGFNVYPAEIESYLNEMPGVAESAVIGVPTRTLARRWWPW